MILHSFFVPLLPERMRIFDYVCIHLSGVFPSNNGVKKAFKNELILLNGKIALSGEWLSEGDKIEVNAQDLGGFKMFPLKLEVLFEDESMAVIHKPAGFTVSGNYYKTIQNALPYNLSVSKEQDALILPRPVHRLDKLTSGLLLVAKTRSAQINLGQQFETQQISKTYVALVKGKLEGEGVLDSSIDQQKAKTFYNSIRVEQSLSYNYVTLVELQPKTGRTHQLRIHMAEIGHPIVGDAVHDFEKILKGKGLFLTACKVSFIHPVSLLNQTFEISLPSKFDALLKREKRRWKKFHA
tara:strand:- start:1775 stop:2662 length:888 start_codon:yes stop_codon:yes gene_type:complete